MPIKKLAGPAVSAVALIALAACSSTTGGNTSLNSQAITAYQTPAAASGLDENRRLLGACIAREASGQRLEGAQRIDTAAIANRCERFELAYRTSVMAQVRPEWRRPEVLNNTANTATRDLYAAILEIFE